MNRWIKGILGVSLVAAPLLSAENVQADSHKQAIETVREEKSQKESDLNVEADKINQLLSNIDEVIASISNLEDNIKETESEITRTERAIEAQKEVVRERTYHVREQLKTMQTSEIGRNAIYTILQSKDLGDMVNRAMSMYMLTDASAQVLAEAQEDAKRLETLHEELVASRGELADQKTKTAEQKKVLDQHIVRIQESLNKQRKELNSISEREEKLVAEVEEKKRQEDAEAEKRAAEQVVTTASSSVSSAPAQTPAASAPAPAQAPAASQPASGWMSFQSTGYSTQQAGLSSYTATGINLLQNPRVIAVDPSIIPLGSIVEVEGMGTYIAGDTGGAIHGYIIDIHFPSVGEAMGWGRRQVNIRILN